MKKSLKKLLPTLALVIVTASLMGTATFAWFTMNTTATFTGMKVNIETYDNLLIADASGSVKSAAENSYKNTLTLTDEATKLAPVSSIDGKNFYYITNRNATAAGQKIEGDYLKYDSTDTTSDTSFAKQYVGKSAYLDYSFELKAINGNTAVDTLDLRLTKLNLQYTGNNATAVGKILAFRAAVFMEAKDSTYPTAATITDPRITDFSAATAIDATPTDDGEDHATNMVMNAIYAPSGVKTFKDLTGTKTYAVALNDKGTLDTSDDKIEEMEVVYNTINTLETTDATDPNSLDKSTVTGKFDTLADETAKYYKVTVRIWLEGEDTTCFNEAYVQLDKDWHLDLAFDLVASGTAAPANVTALTIENNMPTTITAGTGTFTAALTNGKTAISYQWYEVGSSSDTAVDSVENHPEQVAVTSGKTYYCVITAEDLSVYYTDKLEAE